MGVKHDLTTKQLDKKTNRFKPYVTSPLRDHVDDNDDDELSEWSLDENLKRIIYDDESASKKTTALRPKTPQVKPRRQSQQPIKRPAAQTTTTIASRPTNVIQPPRPFTSGAGGDLELAQLLRDQKENDALVERALEDLAQLERQQPQQLLLHGGDDYISKVDVDELLSVSASNDSLSEHFIDWDEVNDLITKLK